MEEHKSNGERTEYMALFLQPAPAKADESSGEEVR
jgi:hypothetical protein